MGSFTILITILAFTAGAFRNELALTLLGTVFLTILAYCFLGVLFMGIIHRKKGASLSITIIRETVSVGKQGELLLKTSGAETSGSARGRNRFWSLPAVLIRCELCLETRDGRVIRHYSDPAADTFSSFPVRERGAYYGEFDRFVINDAPGFFRLSFPVPQSASPRLFAIPAPAEETIPVTLRSGGTEQRSEPHYRKSDELTDHRPYVPGDDPRRINWKLYSHAPLGDLLVREGEPEPPPHSRLLILIDTEIDRSLYTLDKGRQAVDLLCENALAAALEFSRSGMDILIGYTGGKIISGCESGENTPLDPAELAIALALPAAIQWPPLPENPFGASLPEAPADRAVLILALPRVSAQTSALDNFLKNRASLDAGASNGTDIVFIHSEETGEAAATCVNLYNRRSGVHAERILISPVPASDAGRA